MWTRLLYQSSLKEAFTPRMIKGKWIKPLISSRYKAMLKKEFQLAKVPWPLEVVAKTNPRNKKPKGHKSETLKIIKLEKIKKTLAMNDEIILKYRQEKLNTRRLKGNDNLIAQVLPSWITFDREEYFAQKEAEKSEALRDDGEEEVKVKKNKLKPKVIPNKEEGGES